ncbi:hypothetical protein HWQ46_06000 [Shewanella sp. D64]|uniref:hypothetical protein n=1 Tax=unclassified Shewanella TaxID=196818 RepID=UPI0022BA6DA0|nr:MULTISPECIES: hypothetical protein [unclassified Shewanella]MEC4725105.1 hypothetical protein [Shewanella sp. D64]MEC4737006.1 hypothetical protein [Shewanella sp. E94]WBJ96594.1 hypothetical protein HWQ47_05605 [Shewanella sp. MTB7]
MSQQTNKPQVNMVAEQTSIVLSKGQMFSLVMPVGKKEGEEARQIYYRQVLLLGESYGLKREAQLKISDTLVGNFTPGALIFYSWPNEAAENKLFSHPDWPLMKQIRPKGWDEIKIYTNELEQDLRLTFKSAKYYTLAVAWLNPSNPNDYYRYMDNIKETVNALGGRFIYKMHNPRFEAHASPLIAPGQLTFVEWDTKDGLAKFQNSSAFVQHSHLIKSGVNRFELYRLNLG